MSDNNIFHETLSYICVTEIYSDNCHPFMNDVTLFPSMELNCTAAVPFKVIFGSPLPINFQV